MVGTKMKILKSCLSGLVKIAFWSLYYALLACHPCFLFVIKLVVFVLAQIISNKANKILFWNLLVRLGENILKFYLLLIVFNFS